MPICMEKTKIFMKKYMFRLKNWSDCFINEIFAIKMLRIYDAGFSLEI